MTLLFLPAVDYGRSAEIKRPSGGNYENAEHMSCNETESDPSESNDARASRNNKHNSSGKKKTLKGVENAAFNPQEPSQKPSQSESELYFGDVSSCCGPESSLYDVATDKEGNKKCSESKTEAALVSHWRVRKKAVESVIVRFA